MWSSFDKLLPRLNKQPLQQSAAVALALEAGNAYIAAQNPLLITRVKLVSIKGETVHGLSSSAPAVHELKTMREGIFTAMRKAAPVTVTELRIDLRGTLADAEPF